MPKKSISYLKTRFENGDIPTQEDFWDLIDTLLVTETTSSSSGLMTPEEKQKLESIEYNANNYIHPATHSADMIEENSTRRFVSDFEKNFWNSKEAQGTASNLLNQHISFFNHSLLHSHTNMDSLNQVSGINTGDQDLSNFLLKNEIYFWAKQPEKPNYNKDEIIGLNDALNLKINLSEKGSLGGVATLDNSGKIPKVQIPTLTPADVGLENISNEPYIPLSQKGESNGVATLNETGKIPLNQIPLLNPSVVGLENVLNVEQVPITAVNQPNGVAGLDANGKVIGLENVLNVQQVPASAVNQPDGVAGLNANGKVIGLENVLNVEQVPITAVNQPNGVAGLDADGKVIGLENVLNVQQVPASAVNQPNGVAGLDADGKVIGLENVTNHAQVRRDEMGIPFGIATLDWSGKISLDQLPLIDKAYIGLENVTNQTQIPLTEKGIPFGVATLDSTGKVPISQLKINGPNSLPLLDEEGKILNSQIPPLLITKYDVGLGNVTNDAQVKRIEMGSPSGVATLDENGKVPIDQIPDIIDRYVTKMEIGLENVLNVEQIPVSAVNQPNGVAGLDANGKVFGLENVLNIEQIPASALNQPNGVAGLNENGKISLEQLKTNQPGGIPLLDEEGKILNSQIPTLLITKYDVGLGNVTNDAQIPLAQKGASGGVATLDENGKVPLNQLPPISSTTTDEYLTYNELVNKIQNNQLEVNKFYVISDFQNIHAFFGTNEDCPIYGPIEPLKIKAISTSALSTEATSLLYPNDIIKYSIQKRKYFYESIGTPEVSASKGTILYREDPILNIIAHYDWRHETFRRGLENKPEFSDNPFPSEINPLPGTEVYLKTFPNMDNIGYNIYLGPGTKNCIFTEENIFDIKIEEDVINCTFGSSQVLTVGHSNGDLITGKNSHHLNIGECNDGTVVEKNCAEITIDDNFGAIRIIAGTIHKNYILEEKNIIESGIYGFEISPASAFNSKEEYLNTYTPVSGEWVTIYQWEASGRIHIYHDQNQLVTDLSNYPYYIKGDFYLSNPIPILGTKGETNYIISNDPDNFNKGGPFIVKLNFNSFLYKIGDKITVLTDESVNYAAFEEDESSIVNHFYNYENPGGYLPALLPLYNNDINLMRSKVKILIPGGTKLEWTFIGNRKWIFEIKNSLPENNYWPSFNQTNEMKRFTLTESQYNQLKSFFGWN